MSLLRPETRPSGNPSMIQRTLILDVPTDFSFWRTVLSHGWCTLQPFFLNRPRRRLLRVLQLVSQPALVQMQEQNDGGVRVRVCSPGPLGDPDLKAAGAAVAHILRLGESLAEFHRELAHRDRRGRFAWVPGARAGRLLRAPSFFEDMVKMICTTNCSWKATQRMVTGMVQKLGTRLDSDYCCFPTPEQLAGSTARFLSREVGCGYRSGYLIELAEQVASGRLPSGDWADLTGEEAHRRLMATKGIGPYAAGNLLKLLGHYDHLSLDSWVRPKFAAVHGLKKVPHDSAIQRHYRRFGRWQGLVLWLDLTRDWFEDANSRHP